MKAIYKKPGEPAEIVDIESTPQAIRAALGGWPEGYPIATDACILCDEDGRGKGLPFNTVIYGLDFVGPILVMGGTDDFADLKNPEQVLELLWPKK